MSEESNHVAEGSATAARRIPRTEIRCGHVAFSPSWGAQRCRKGQGHRGKHEAKPTRRVTLRWSDV